MDGSESGRGEIMTRKALIDDNNDVQNVIVADEGYEHPQYDVIDAENRRVQPGDYYDPEANGFVTPRLEIDAPDTIPNDGTEVEINIETTARDEQTATLEVDDYSEEIAVLPDETFTEQITTTADAGTEIAVSVDNEDIRGDSVTIEVVEA